MTAQGDIAPLRAYEARVVDSELDALLDGLGAISLEGPKGVGKTATARRRAATVVELDDPQMLEVVRADLQLLATGRPPILIDEWQRYPPSWDAVRRAVDDDPSPGRFLLTGSATPTQLPTHSGAGRIVRLRVRPMTLSERGLEVPTVSLAQLLSGDQPALSGRTDVDLQRYVTEILAGGFPGMRAPNPTARRRAIDGYLDQIAQTDLPELGIEVRHPGTLRRWMAAYAAATATTASYEKIRNAATAGEATPAKTTVIPYREALERLWLLEPLAAWAPTSSHLNRLTFTPKHHLADPALAARLVGVEAAALLAGQGPATIPRDGTFLGALFESLTALSLRTYAQANEVKLSHFRTRGGRHEVDFIIERGDVNVVAVEVKLSETVGDAEVKHLRWLKDQLGDRLMDSMVITTGKYAYRRPDGIGVVPLALLGP